MTPTPNKHVLRTTTTTERVIPDRYVRLALKVNGGPIAHERLLELAALIEDAFWEWYNEL